MTSSETNQHDVADPSRPTRDAERLAQAHDGLLRWYAQKGRDLPWRHTRDPYAVLVSEIMLQQTQVERVLPKYREFLERFPTLGGLAEAPTADVIRAWSPLGYNVRAVRLQLIARQAVAEHGGTLPDTLEALLALKGIGRYTAGAIACFAFGLPVATVDTNIRRVLWRMLRGVEPLEWPTGQRAARVLLDLAVWALPPGQEYDWQQALMDLGATICVSRQPGCERCPVANACAAFAEVASVTLFPSGEALANLRQARAARSDEAGHPERTRRVAEGKVTYAAGTGGALGSPSARKATHTRQANVPFAQSSRYFRGRILAALRDLAPHESLGLDELGSVVKPDWVESDRPWLHTLVRGLERDGLVQIERVGDGPDAMRLVLP